jgi:hypothetical protein
VARRLDAPDRRNGPERGAGRTMIFSDWSAVACKQPFPTSRRDGDDHRVALSLSISISGEKGVLPRWGKPLELYFHSEFDTADIGIVLNPNEVLIDVAVLVEGQDPLGQDLAFHNGR